MTDLVAVAAGDSQGEVTFGEGLGHAHDLEERRGDLPRKPERRAHQEQGDGQDHDGHAPGEPALHGLGGSEGAVDGRLVVGRPLPHHHIDGFVAVAHLFEGDDDAFAGLAVDHAQRGLTGQEVVAVDGRAEGMQLACEITGFVFPASMRPDLWWI